jgi:DNA helicase-2/ATP-dependent DNA helicase PcrA
MRTAGESPAPEEILENLNAEQRRAVTHGEGPLLVVAGAGTGKTRVITQRIAYLLATQPDLEGENILGLTYTDKAAGEMKSRVVRLMGERGKSVKLSTFHSFCFSEILAQVEPGLRAIDEQDHWVLLRRNIALLELKHFKRVADPGEFLTEFVKFFSRCQDEMVSPADYEAYVHSLIRKYAQERSALDEAARAVREEVIEKEQELARVYRVSEDLLREKKLVTYGGQMFHAVRLVRENATLREMLQEKFRYILVDEFQDTNHAQIELLRMLAGRQRNIMAVGDDDQAIYKFRGASFGTFQIFARDFLGEYSEAERKKRIIALVENYRSTQRILRVANQLIQQNGADNRFLPDKQLITNNGEGARVRIAEFEYAEGEAEWVAAEIERLRNEGREWGDFAALYRQHRHRELLVDALTRRGIPFVIRGLSVLENPVVRDVLAGLRLIANHADNVALARAVAAPAWEFSPSALQRLGQRAGKGKLWETLETAAEDPQFLREAPKAKEFLAFYRSLRNRAAGKPMLQVFDLLVEELALDLPPQNPHAPFLRRFREFVKDWATLPITEKETLAEFLDYFDFYLDAGGSVTIDEAADRNAVSLMTVHGAKGLEFPHVFVIRLSAQSFPTRERPPLIVFPRELSKEIPTDGMHYQEERRLCYVALTRAEKQLTLSTVTRKRVKQSVFLEDILMNGELQRKDIQQFKPPVPTPPPPVLVAHAELPPRAGSHIGRWTREYVPHIPVPLELSETSVRAYERCALQYFIGEIWRVRGLMGAAATFGTIMHSTIREFISAWKQDKQWTFEELEKWFQERWRSSGFEDTYQEAEYKREGHEQLRAFYDYFSAHPDDVIYQEREFKMPAENDVVISGRLDQVNRIEGNATEILDYKTGKPKSQEQVDEDLQLSLYYLAARDELGLLPARVAFHNLVTNERIASTRDEETLSDALQQVQEAADGIRARHFAPDPGFACNYCDFQLLCPAHELLVILR